jgi:hypothetical protein
MPLPSVANGAEQCQVMTKRTGKRCLNPAAYNCRACRMHGAHKSRRSLLGADHPQYTNGYETKEARAERSWLSVKLLYLRDIGDRINLFVGTKTRGRRPNRYIKLDLNDPLQMQIAIAMTMCEK